MLSVLFVRQDGDVKGGVHFVTLTQVGMQLIDSTAGHDALT